LTAVVTDKCPSEMGYFPVPKPSGGAAILKVEMCGTVVEVDHFVG